MKKSMSSQSSKPETKRGQELKRDIQESQRKGEGFKKQTPGSDARKTKAGHEL